ncbi:MAG: D-alanine--D-alanine ligase [Rhodobacteraceae bacterium]|nr:D-alanine--D-alanine ligase [Paracoccaceae bacterium]
MSSRASPKVAVLMGGPSAEREVSLSSGRGCAAALRAEGFDVVEVDAGPDLAQRLADIAPDVAFNALHGRWGEDGCVQGMLEWLRIPYTHSGVLASALAMDKERSKAAYRVAGLPVMESRLACKDEVEARHVLPPPYVVKPNNEGSSVGVYIVAEGANSPPKLGAAMPEVVIDILTDGWYDYDAKYKPGGSRHVIPAEIPAEIEAACLDYALRAHRTLGCRGVSRTDFRWDEARGLAGLVLLETNTQPGMTPTSLAPEQAAHVGVSFGALCRWMVEDASCDR